MKKEFEAEAREMVEEYCRSGADAATAARELERLCGKRQEEFHPAGPILVEEIYKTKLAQLPGGGGVTTEELGDGETPEPLPQAEPDGSTKARDNITGREETVKPDEDSITSRTSAKQPAKKR